MFNESPKKKIYIKSDEWFGKGEENLQEGSTFVSCEYLGGLNPPNRLLEKFISNTHECTGRATR